MKKDEEDANATIPRNRPPSPRSTVAVLSACRGRRSGDFSIPVYVLIFSVLPQSKSIVAAMPA
jgi:hypothetical protein